MLEWWLTQKRNGGSLRPDRWLKTTRIIHYSVLKKNVDICPVPADVLQLLFNSFTYLLRSTLFAFDKIQIVFSDLFTVHSGLVVIVVIADPVYHSLQIFPCLVQKVNILG